MSDIDNCNPQGSDRPTVVAQRKALVYARINGTATRDNPCRFLSGTCRSQQGVMIIDSTSAGKDESVYFAKASNAATPVVILIHE